MFLQAQKLEAEVLAPMGRWTKAFVGVQVATRLFSLQYILVVFTGNALLVQSGYIRRPTLCCTKVCL